MTLLLETGRKETLQKMQTIFSAIYFTNEYYSNKMLHTKLVLAVFHYFLSVCFL